ncbi:MAG: PIG-L family deacetylase [Bacteroidota bacterium]|nr:PIG-L family deacetylase [Bacteroidota bacterium]
MIARYMNKIVLLISISCLLMNNTVAQSNYTSADIFLGLRKLNVLGTVLYVAAHPDDENTRLLTYFSKDKLYRTGYLSITRGDGGQNLIGDEQGVELGLIRTQELLSARKMDGAEQFFTRAFDFGYSKTPQETFAKWDKEKILADVVWVIRKFQPDVIITRFPSTGEGGHGHHTASAILANEAFTIAADATRFPEQLKWVQPWQAKRIVWNSFNFGGNNTQRSDQFKFDVGGYNPVLGKSYGEIAAESRSQHKSQGFGVAKTRGEALEYFSTTGGDAMTSDLFENVVMNWQKIPGAENVSRLIQSVINSFDFLQPQRSVPTLVQIYKGLLILPSGNWRNKKIAETKNLIEAASGLWIESFTPQQYAVQGDSLRINSLVNNRLGVNATLNRISFDGFDSSLQTLLSANKNLTINKTVLIPEDKALTQPYWIKEKMNEGYFTVTDQNLIGEPDVQPSIMATYDLVIEGEKLSFIKPVRYKFTDPVKGEVYQPITVLPPLSVNTNPSLVIIKKNNAEKRNIIITAKANKEIYYKKAEVSLRLPRVELSSVTDTGKVFRKNEIKQYDFPINQPRFWKEEYGYPFVKIDTNLQQAFLALSTINYDHIPSINYFYTDAVKFLPIDLKTAGKKIGYIVGAGDKVPEALDQMGFDVTFLTDKELARNKLKDFDAIISGVRAYNTNEWLNKYYENLMKYVEAGGNLIVQYNTSNQIGPVRSKIGPYNFTISRNRITDENAAVDFLKPTHPVLNYPNKITGDDFKGWVQERSIYQATELDNKFEAILGMNDPGEKTENGSLVIASYGKGFFTYTGLVFFRELPAGVPGAYRLLANLIALNQKKEF